MATSTTQIAEIELTQHNTSDEIADSIELLRQILSKEQQREVTYEDAQEIGESLIDFYQVLAEGVVDEPTA